MAANDEKREYTEGENPTVDDTYYYLPTHLGPSLPHYYGDYVRKLLIGAAALILVLAPYFAGHLLVTLPFEIVGALLMVTFGALTSPKKQWAVAGDVIISGLFILEFEAVAFYAYFQGDMLMFFSREALAVLLLFAFYFSIKTLRAMMMHQIGKREPPGEFLKPTVEERWHDTHSWL